MTPAVFAPVFEALRAEPRRLFIPIAFPDLNELMAANRRFVRTPNGGKVPAYAELKNQLTGAAAGYARRANLAPATGRQLVVCVWHESNDRRDPDGVVAGGRKIVLDALGPGRAGARGWQGAGVLHCDKRHCIAGFLDFVIVVSGTPGVDVVLAPYGGEP